jgi:hypothetical protein
MYTVLATIVADPERQLWHRAMSADGADEEIAAALENHARTARGRGAVTVAGAALERAAALTADPHKKGARLLGAAEIAYELGLVDVIRRLLPQAALLDLGPLEVARLAWLQQMISGTIWYEVGAARTFVTIAEQMRDGGDQDIALRSLIPIAHRSWWTRPQTRTRQYLVDAARGMGIPADDPRVLAVVALAHPEMTSASVLRQLAEVRLRDVADPVAALYAGIAAEKAGTFPPECDSFPVRWMACASRSGSDRSHRRLCISRGQRHTPATGPLPRRPPPSRRAWRAIPASRSMVSPSS